MKETKINERPDPKWERVKREVKSEVMFKEMPKTKSKANKPLSAFINDYC
jgi:hypothetical protein